jgi:hypothetical protein
MLRKLCHRLWGNGGNLAWVVRKMVRKFCDLSPRDLAALPALTFDHSCIGQEIIQLHLYNKKNMHWYLSEYGSISKKFFGFFENKADGLTSGQCSYEDILLWAKKGSDWEPLVDESWKPVAAREIPILVEYIKLMILQPDLT